MIIYKEKPDRISRRKFFLQSAALPDQQLQVCEPSTAVIAGGKDACSLGKSSRQGKDISIQRSGHGILPASRTLSGGIAVLPDGFGVTVHIAVAADGAGVGGVTLLRAGGGGDDSGVAVAAVGYCTGFVMIAFQ